MYPKDLLIDYTTDEEYQTSIIQIFGKDFIHFEKITDFVHDSTIHNEVFKQLYLTAAGQLLSENVFHGMTIMFSFDYFTLFHQLLSTYLSTNTIDDSIVSRLQSLMSNDYHSTC